VADLAQLPEETACPVEPNPPRAAVVVVVDARAAAGAEVVAAVAAGRLLDEPHEPHQMDRPPQ